MDAGTGLRARVPDFLVALALVAGMLGMIGVFLDTAWHRTIGRDSFFILPHALVYGAGVGIGAAAVAGTVLPLLGRDADFGGLFVRLRGRRVPFGWALTGLGILVILAAGPFDAWWHDTFGKDALIWSPPHLLLHLGAGITAIGLLFAVAAQRGRGALARPWLWQAAMIAVLIDLVHRTHFILAHYTMIPETRTPDLYPFIVALLLPMVLVAAARAVGPWAPTLAATAFVGVAWLMDLMLRVIGFDRYTLTPVFAVPALALSLLWRGRARTAGAGRALTGGALVVVVFVAMETICAAAVVGRPWPAARVLAALPFSLVAGALSGWVGWVLGGFLVATSGRAPPASVFGGAGRARLAAVAAIVLAALGLASTYRPQVYGPPMSVAELRLAPLPAFREQEAVFWEVLLGDEWPREPRVTALSEGVIDTFPLPIGPAWCAPTRAELDAQWPRVRFSLTVNGAPVELASYPRVDLTLHDGRRCAWIGVAALAQRASENRFVYLVTAPAADGSTRRARVDMDVIFKDP